MADRNEPVGANLRRMFQRNRTQDEQDILDAYRKQIPVDEIRRSRTPRTEPAAEADMPSITVVAPAREAVGPFQPRSGIMNAEGTNEMAAATSDASVRAEMDRRAAVRRANAARTNARTRPSAAPANEMSADDLNAMSLTRGVGADNAPDTAAAANIRRRLAEMGQGMKKGGKVKKMAKGGVVKSSASSRGDGCAARGKTKGRMV